MKLESAIARIQKSFAKLNEAYGRPVFDELAIIQVSEEVTLTLHYYEGAREAAFLNEMMEDSVALRNDVGDTRNNLGGEFGFTREGGGEGIDAYICLGPRIFLLCNNTKQSMEEVTKDARWLTAQSQFLNASQYFAVDPLTI
ncbi:MULTISPECIES: hypothetical protein [unclassified Lentimonas]|uniref:hypothetical protein n=1 Tax=unclassified Lentimonas TaxID=2630993 RepID=UPI001389BCB0|nr:MULTISPECIES: hypothetical protein [unclassified Lentimonas]